MGHHGQCSLGFKVCHEISIIYTEGTIYPANCKQDCVTDMHAAQAERQQADFRTRSPGVSQKVFSGELTCAHIKQERFQLLTAVGLLFKKK